jgi:hypothetical protein
MIKNLNLNQENLFEIFPENFSTDDDQTDKKID